MPGRTSAIERIVLHLAPTLQPQFRANSACRDAPTGSLKGVIDPIFTIDQRFLSSASELFIDSKSGGRPGTQILLPEHVGALYRMARAACEKAYNILLVT